MTKRRAKHLDPNWKYQPSSQMDTDYLKRKFAKIRRELKAQPANVLPIKKKGSGK